MNLEKEALEYLVNIGREEDTIVKDDNGNEYINPNYRKLKEETCETLNVRTLDSIAEYINSPERSNEIGELFIHVCSPTTVAVMSTFNKDKERNIVLRAEADLPEVKLNRSMELEELNIQLQSCYIDNEHKSTLLAYTSLITDDAVKEYKDDGISQSVVVRNGVSSKAEAELPNPVKLIPFRSFPEIEQVESKFIFRMENGGISRLIPADGNVWKIEAVEKIKKYLQEKIAKRILIIG